MPSYVLLMKLTDQGIKAIKEAPGRIEARFKALEGVGGKIIGFYTVMGEYDHIGIVDLPSDEVAATFSLAVGSAGNVRTTTLKAFTQEEFAEIVKKMP